MKTSKTAARIIAEANAPKGSALESLLIFAAKRPGLDPANYGDGYEGPATWRGLYRRRAYRKAYRSEADRIARTLGTLRTLARSMRDNPATDAELIHAAPRAFSGRLSIKSNGAGWIVSYCVGQYFPTEYRAAALAVLQQVAHDRADAYGDTAPPHTFSDRPTWGELRRVNEERGGHFWERGSVRFFRSRNEGQPRRLADGRAAFVYSIAIDDRPSSRFYKVATMDAAGDVDTLSNDEHPTRAAALAALRAL